MSRIRERRLELGWTLDELGAKAGVSAAQVSRWERGLSSMGLLRAQRVAGALGIAPAELHDSTTFYASATTQIADTPETPESNVIPVPMEGASERRMTNDLPIFGTALGAPRVFGGEMVEQTTLNTGEVVQYARRPVILDGRADAYGLFVQGHSMDPVHLEGDMVLAETKRPARVGDDVVVYLRPEEEEADDGLRARGVLLKRLVRRTAQFVELQQFNPPMVFRLGTEQVLRIDRTLRLADLID